MDPAQAIADYLRKPRTHKRPRIYIANGLREWFAAGGFHPMVEDVGIILRRDDKALPDGWATIARQLGALG